MSTKPIKKITPYQQVDIKLIVRNPEQPRKIFNQVELQELSDSIREHGVIQPLALEACNDSFILHDGERRWRAAAMAGLKTVPAVVTAPLNGTGPRERLERALVANVQRSEMHPIEEGFGYQRLITEFGYSLKDVVKRAGKHYTRVHYCLDLLKLDAEIQQLMLERKLPCERKAKDAFLSVGNKTDRVKLAAALAERNATANMIVYACHRFNMAKNGAKKKIKGSPAIKMVQMSRPEWDALWQLGKVPPWQVVTNAVMATCDACPLRDMASDATCSDCALVIGLKRMMEASNGHKH
jgi:ParB-like partition proteins